MSIRDAKFPEWVGDTPDRESVLVDREPSAEDWNQLTAELLRLQSGFKQPDITIPAIGTLTGTQRTLLLPASGSSVAANAAVFKDNFITIRGKIVTMLILLRAAGLLD